MKTTASHITVISIRVNPLLLLLSILGWYLTSPTAPMAGFKRLKEQVILFLTRPQVICVPVYTIMLERVKKFKMRFALFPAWPVTAQIMIREGQPRKKRSRGTGQTGAPR
ncbi:MAG: hypothetical protein LBF27_31555 [Sphingobacterium sp.]|jgi:hypothetical protein|nr:hypothetical protein [Sphingobacterium sp.]